MVSSLLVDSWLLDFFKDRITATPEPLPSPTIVGQCEIIGVVPDVHGSSVKMMSKKTTFVA